MKKVKVIMSFVIVIAFFITSVMTTGIIIGNAASIEIEIKNADELAIAIANQADGQIWKIAAGEYDLGETQLNEYKTLEIETQSNWYFPIIKKISIIGTGNPLITSSYNTANGSWNTQNFITVAADDVSIEGLQIACKKSVNKAIEVLGKNVKIKNCELLGVTQTGSTVFSGSILFNPQNGDQSVGDALIENVTVDGHLSAREAVVSNGTITLKNVVLNFSNNTYAASPGFGIISPNDCFVNEGLTVVVDNSIANISSQILDCIPDGTIIELASDIELDSQLYIDEKDITIDGKGHTITASNSFPVDTTLTNPENLVSLYNSNVDFKNVKIEATEKSKHVLNVVQSSATLTNVELDHTKGKTGAPLIVNTSKVTVNDELTVVTGANSWYGINIENKYDSETSLSFGEQSSFIYKGNTELSMIQKEGSGEATIIAPVNAGLIEVDGQFRYIIPVEALTLNKATLNVNINDTETLTYTVNPENADILSDAVWTSSDATVVKVENGKITALKAGTATITLTIDGVSADCEVTVNGSAATVSSGTVSEGAVSEYNPPTNDFIPGLILFALVISVALATMFLKNKKIQD